MPESHDELVSPTPEEGPPEDPARQPRDQSAGPPADTSSTAILPFGDRLDEIAQERFNRTDWIELAAAVILALATIVAAWSAYQATRWGGEQAKATSSAAAVRTEAAQVTTIYGSNVEIDALLWSVWLLQAADERPAGQAFMEERFRDEFKPAFQAWLAQVPAGENPPGTPFSMPEYRPAEEAEWAALEAEADVLAQRAADANQTGDNFVLTAVVMASVLFFAGVGTKLKGRAVRLLMLAFAMLLFLGGLSFMLSLPQNVGV